MNLRNLMPVVAIILAGAQLPAQTPRIHGAEINFAYNPVSPFHYHVKASVGRVHSHKQFKAYAIEGDRSVLISNGARVNPEGEVHFDVMENDLHGFTQNASIRIEAEGEEIAVRPFHRPAADPSRPQLPHH